jgi:hypothetical protein
MQGSFSKKVCKRGMTASDTVARASVEEHFLSHERCVTAGLKRLN